MSDNDLRVEIEALRREIAALRAERVAAAKSSEAEAEVGADQVAANLLDQVQTLAREISAFAEEAEKGVLNHPLMSVLGALVLGMLLGRMMHR